MKVEFVADVSGNDWTLRIPISELVKGKSNDDEYNSFAAATDAFSRLEGCRKQMFIDPDSYNHILSYVKGKSGYLVVSIVEHNFRTEKQFHYELIQDNTVRPITGYDYYSNAEVFL